MSKNKQATRAQKKHQKDLKRKGRNTLHTNKVKLSPAKTVEERLAARVKSAVKQSRTRDYVQQDTTTLINEAKDKVKELRFIHYYLIFAKILFENKLLEGVFNYDVVKATLLIKSINEQLRVIPLLEDETAIQVELYDIGEKIINLSETVNKYVMKLEPFQVYISNVVMQLGEKLPEREDGRPRKAWEIENEVLRIQAIEYIAEHVYNTPLKGNVNE